MWQLSFCTTDLGPGCVRTLDQSRDAYNNSTNRSQDEWDVSPIYFLIKIFLARAWWHKPVIPALWKMDTNSELAWTVEQKKTVFLTPDDRHISLSDLHLHNDRPSFFCCYIFVYLCACICDCMWSQDNLSKLVLSFYHLGPKPFELRSSCLVASTFIWQINHLGGTRWLYRPLK